MPIVEDIFKSFVNRMEFLSHKSNLVKAIQKAFLDQLDDTKCDGWCLDILGQLIYVHPPASLDLLEAWLQVKGQRMHKADQVDVWATERTWLIMLLAKSQDGTEFCKGSKWGVHWD